MGTISQDVERCAEDDAALAGSTAEPEDRDRLITRGQSWGLGDGGLLDISGEARAAKAKQIPIMPDEAERHKHRGREDSHYRQDHTGDDLHRVMFDYCLSGAGDSGPATVLVLVDRSTGAEHSSASLMHGRKRIVLESDAEPPERSLLTLAKAVRDARSEETVLQQGPRMDSQSKGLVKAYNGVVEGLLRVYCAHVQHHYNIQLLADSPLLSWLVRHVGWSLTRYQQKSDGSTAYRRLRGRDYHGPWSSSRGVGDHCLQVPRDFWKVGASMGSWTMAW
eukprot:1739702-Amphidinium_carterae.2